MEPGGDYIVVFVRKIWETLESQEQWDLHRHLASSLADARIEGRYFCYVGHDEVCAPGIALD